MWKMTKSNYYEVIDGTTMYYEDYVKRLQEENEELKKNKMTPDELVSLLNQELVRESKVLIEFEKWLEEQNVTDLDDNFTVIRLLDIKNKLQKLKNEGKK